MKVVKLGKNIDGWPVSKTWDVCEQCEEYPVMSICHNCGLRICEDCWRELSGVDNVKHCPVCPGAIYK